MRTPEERFADLPGFPCEPRYADLPAGVRMHYVDEGPPGRRDRAPAARAAHVGLPLSHRLAGLVAHGLRAVAPDLIGFGRSDKPLARTAHTVEAHVDWITQFADASRARRPHARGAGLGRAASASRCLDTRPGLVRRVVATNTALHTADPSLAGRLAWACHAPAHGTVNVEPALLDYQRLTQELTPLRPSLFVQGATASAVPDDVLAAYDAPFPDETFCAGPRQLPLLMGLTPSSACARLNRRTHGCAGALRRALPHRVLRR